MTVVAICICTFRRPRELRKLLESLQTLDTTQDVRVFVADNDPQSAEGLRVCQSQNAAGFRWPLKALLAREPGISSARNVVIEAALADPTVDCLAMLDDDEWVEPDWLTQLLKTRDETKADITAGKVIVVFEGPEEAWRAGCSVYRLDDGADGVVATLYGAGNILASREALQRLPQPIFDPAFSFTGGEDRHFLKVAKRHGITFARSSRARVYELYPAERATRRWVLDRAYRLGSTEVLSDRRLGMTLAQVARFWMRMPLALALDLWKLVTAQRGAAAINALCDLYRDFGRLATMLGRRRRGEYGGGRR